MAIYIVFSLLFILIFFSLIHQLEFAIPISTIFAQLEAPLVEEIQEFNETDSKNVTNTIYSGEELLPSLIVTLKTPNAIDDIPLGMSALDDTASSLTRQLEDQGFNVTTESLFRFSNGFSIGVGGTSNMTMSPNNNTEMEELNLQVEKVKTELEQDPRVEKVEQDSTFEPFQQTISTGVDRSDADLSPVPGKSGDGKDRVEADIAILDSGIFPHPDLYLFKEMSTYPGSTPEDNCGHGTKVAGIAAARDNDIGIVGTAPGARLWNIKVMEKQPDGGCIASATSVIEGLEYVLDNKDEIDVVNLSLGDKCPPSLERCTGTTVEKLIQQVVQEGITVVVAAGNWGIDAINVNPARFQEVITVSNVADSDGKCGGLGKKTNRGPDDTLARNSNYGSVIDIAAPGVNILTTDKSGFYVNESGTSMSAPLVTGMAALIKSIFPHYGPSEIKNAIIESASTDSTLCDGNGFGYFTLDRDDYPEPLVNMRNISADEVIYENQTYGIKFYYPSDWRSHLVPDSRPDDDIVELINLYPPQTGNESIFKEQLDIRVDTRSPIGGLTSYLNQIIHGYSEHYWDSFDIIEASANKMIGNNTVYTLDSTYTHPEFGPMRELDVGMIKNNRVYFFQYFAEPSEYEKYYPIVSKILNKVHISEVQ